MREETPTTRERTDVMSLRNNPRAKVLIVGGGVNGAATFRDLALQGIDVALVERADYGSGASAASSHMIHGGIRYLENGEFRLVRESVRERNDLLVTAPHYVRPLRTTVPIFSMFSGILSAPLRMLLHRSGRPRERGAALVKIGLTVYDLFSRDGGRVPRHVFRGRARSIAELPQLNLHTRFTATYYDASVRDPERLIFDLLRDGTREGPHARAANYVEAVGAEEHGVILRDCMSGHEFIFHADVVIVASGPWTDLSNGALGLDSHLLGGTKGSHIVLDNPALLDACGDREIFFENSDGRIVLVYPIKGKVLVGTTDLEADIQDQIVCTDDEVDYFFELVAHVFPTVSVSKDDIVYRYSGLRPLPAHGDLQPSFVSRDYRVISSTLPSNPSTTVLSVVGGKWTTFRALAEHLSRQALAILGESREVETLNRPIGGGRGFPPNPSQRSVWVASFVGPIGAERVEQLLDRYGTSAAEVIDILVKTHDIPLNNAPDFSTAEIKYLTRSESVIHLTDLIFRRTDLAFTGRLTSALLAELADLVADVLEWSPVRRAQEVSEALGVLRRNHGVDLTSARGSVAV